MLKTNKTEIKKIFIIAEMAWAHDGSVEKALEITKLAKICGADAISIHLTDLDSYMVPHYGSGEGRVSAGENNQEIFSYLKSINLSQPEWINLVKTAKEIGLAVCAMPNDAISLEFCEQALLPDYYSLSAASFIDKSFIKQVANTSKPTFFRIGGATLGEIESTVNLFKENKGGNIVLLHGIQNYPTVLAETNIRKLRTLSQIFGLSVGLADHIDGGDPLAKILPILAIAEGAEYFEKHITLDRATKGEDFEAALNPEDFKDFVHYVRSAEIALGHSNWTALSEREMHYRDVSRKKIVAARTINANKKIDYDDLTFKRADVGLTPEYLESVIGRTANTDLHQNDGITLRDLK